MTDLIHIHTELAPGDPLVTDHSRSELLRVIDGVVFVRGEDDDAVLTPGDSIILRAGEPRHIWNAGDETARVSLVQRETGCPEGARYEQVAKAA